MGCQVNMYQAFHWLLRSVFLLAPPSGGSLPISLVEKSHSIQAFSYVQCLFSSGAECQIMFPSPLCKSFIVPVAQSQTHFPRVAIYSAGAGGNYILDATNFLEFIPTKWAWLLTFMSIWWPVGYAVTGLLAWGFMSNYSCDPEATTATCLRTDNMGWRYLHFVCGSLVLVMALARLFLIKMVQTPRWLISQNRDEEAIKYLDDIANKYERTHNLTLAQLQNEGRVLHTEKSVWSALRIKLHVKGLFQTRKLGWSTTVILANWFVIGMVTPLYVVFLPFYLASQGANTGDGSNYTTWRNYAVNQVAGLAGPAIAAVLVETRWTGRRGTLAIGALITMVLQFGYTQIKTPAQNLGVSAAITAASWVAF